MILSFDWSKTCEIVKEKIQYTVDLWVHIKELCPFCVLPFLYLDKLMNSQTDNGKFKSPPSSLSEKGTKWL